jgi:hypothetical protein
LIVQIIEFRTVTYPSLLAEMMELLAESPDQTPTPPPADLPEMSKLKLAIAKIRKVVTWTAKPMPQAQMAGA